MEKVGERQKAGWGVGGYFMWNKTFHVYRKMDRAGC